MGHFVDHYIFMEMIVFQRNERKTLPVYPNTFANALTNQFCSLKNWDINSIGNLRQYGKMAHRYDKELFWAIFWKCVDHYIS